MPRGKIDLVTESTLHDLCSYDALPTHHWLIAPPVSLRCDPTAQTLKLYTIQSRQAYEELVREGVLIGDSTLGCPEFREAYSWMHRAMGRRVVPGRGTGLLWLWARTSRSQLRRDAKQSHGDVLLSARVDRDRVLVSEFSDWHAALNRVLHVPAIVGEKEDTWERRADEAFEDFEGRAAPFVDLPLAQWPKELRDEIEGSWESIFDPATWEAKRPLQATMRELRAADVVRAVRIR